ncbi:MAG: N-acetyltransferase [Hyphomicrobiales bacterium]|nr:N-acetyltransferase [Hyphomicrobiales bacterium]
MVAPEVISPLTPADAFVVKSLHEQAFGPGRFARTAYRVREGCALEDRLCLKVELSGALAGAIHFAPIEIGGRGGALLLGPLAIAPQFVNQGWGLKLILEGARRGAELGYELILLVGDLPYYARARFSQVPMGRIRLPGPVDPARLLWVELAPGAFARYSGDVRGLPRPL